MKIGFVSLPVAGHFNPMSALARQLQSRNHDVVVLSLPLIAPLAHAANLSFIPFGAKEFPDQASVEIISTLSRLKGEEASAIHCRRYCGDDESEVERVAETAFC